MENDNRIEIGSEIKKQDPKMVGSIDEASRGIRLADRSAISLETKAGIPIVEEVIMMDGLSSGI